MYVNFFSNDFVPYNTMLTFELIFIHATLAK